MSRYIIAKMEIIYNKLCEKPTPLGVGWIAQNKNNVYVEYINRFWHEPYAIANGYKGIFDSESLIETH